MPKTLQALTNVSSCSTFAVYLVLSIQGNRHLFIAADRQIPRIRIETRQAESLMGKRIIVSIDAWPRNSRFPMVSLGFVILLFFRKYCNSCRAKGIAIVDI